MVALYKAGRRRFPFCAGASTVPGEFQMIAAPFEWECIRLMMAEKKGYRR